MSSVRGADAVVFTSGSAAESWADGFGEQAASVLPGMAIAIGPTTAAAAHDSGLKISSTSADHSLAGVVRELIQQWRTRR